MRLLQLENGLKGNTRERNWTHLIRYRFVNNLQYLEEGEHIKPDNKIDKNY